MSFSRSQRVWAAHLASCQHTDGEQGRCGRAGGPGSTVAKFRTRARTRAAVLGGVGESFVAASCRICTVLMGWFRSRERESDEQKGACVHGSPQGWLGEPT